MLDRGQTMLCNGFLSSIENMEPIYEQCLFFSALFSLFSHAHKNTLSVRPVLVNVLWWISLTIAWFWQQYYISESNFRSSGKKNDISINWMKSLLKWNLWFFVAYEKQKETPSYRWFWIGRDVALTPFLHDKIKESRVVKILQKYYYPNFAQYWDWLSFRVRCDWNAGIAIVAHRHTGTDTHQDNETSTDEGTQKS